VTKAGRLTQPIGFESTYLNMSAANKISPDDVNLGALIGHARKNAYGALRGAMRSVKERRPDLSGNALYVKTITVLGDGSFARGIDRVIQIASLSSHEVDRVLSQ